MRIGLRNRSGYTLIEMLVVAVIMLILMTIGFPMWRKITKSRGVEEAASKVQATLLKARSLSARHGTAFQVRFNSTEDYESFMCIVPPDDDGYAIAGGYVIWDIQDKTPFLATNGIGQVLIAWKNVPMQLLDENDELGFSISGAAAAAGSDVTMDLGTTVITGKAIGAVGSTYGVEFSWNDGTEGGIIYTSSGDGSFTIKFPYDKIDLDTKGAAKFIAFGLEVKEGGTRKWKYDDPAYRTKSFDDVLSTEYKPIDASRGDFRVVFTPDERAYCFPDCGSVDSTIGCDTGIYKLDNYTFTCQGDPGPANATQAERTAANAETTKFAIWVGGEYNPELRKCIVVDSFTGNVRVYTSSSEGTQLSATNK